MMEFFFSTRDHTHIQLGGNLPVVSAAAHGLSGRCGGLQFFFELVRADRQSDDKVTEAQMSRKLTYWSADDIRGGVFTADRPMCKCSVQLF